MEVFSPRYTPPCIIAFRQGYYAKRKLSALWTGGIKIILGGGGEVGCIGSIYRACLNNFFFSFFFFLAGIGESRSLNCFVFVWTFYRGVSLTFRHARFLGMSIFVRLKRNTLFWVSAYILLYFCDKISFENLGGLTREKGEM